MLVYIFLAHGKKPKTRGEVITHVAARGQMRNIAARYSTFPTSEDRFNWDYARAIQCLDDLPRLAKFLRRLHASGQGVILVDDLARIFRACALDRRIDLMAELEPFGAHIGSLRHSKTLSTMPGDMKANLISHAELIQNWSARGARKVRMSDADRAEQTLIARDASIVARQVGARCREDMILSLKDELEADGVARSALQLAEEANRRGSRTAHGRAWSERAVKDMIRRAKKALVRVIPKATPEVAHVSPLDA
ncbi:MAG: hypothetical protein GC186_00110 [Rhodobacteraceae bacterium]|nr:hypothetical protein [Paracoccaceae bacterium]